MIRSGRYAAAACLFAGALSPLAFAPLGWAWLMFPCLALLFVVLEEVDIRGAARCGFLFGLGMFGVGASWVYVSLKEYGNMPVLLAAVCVVGFVALLALFPLLAAVLQGLFRHRSRAARLLLVMPACWTVAEFLRNHLLTGFSWLEAGYSQLDAPLGGWASVLGVHGVTLLTAIGGGLLALLVLEPRRYRSLLAGGALLFASGLAPGAVEWTRPASAPVRAALVQASVPLDTKWNFAVGERVAATYLSLSRQAAPADLVIWPESALPFFLDQMGESFHREAATLPGTLLAGFLERRPVAGGFDYYNSAVLFSDPPQLYRKRHLVPFGEYTPLAWLFAPIIEYFEVPMSILTPWLEPQRPMRLGDTAIGMSICYEDAFPHDIRPLAADSGLLVNITEDAWFGDSLGPHQRLQMARMRARETGRPMFRASNTGLAALIDHRGALVAVSPQFQAAVLEGELQPRSGATPYVTHGNTPVLMLLATALLGGILMGRRRI